MIWPPPPFYNDWTETAPKKVEVESQYRAVWSDLGLVEYGRASRLMQALAARVGQGGPGCILFLEHPPTITLGYSLKGDEGRSAIRSTPGQLAAAGVTVAEVDRGGKATYHGPGQIVCYPILSLKELRLGIKRYVGKLQELVLAALKDLGVEAGLDPLYPGVWTPAGKVAAVGIRVTERVATHGFALNLDPDLKMFGHIVPCGISDRPVTSLAALGVRPERGMLLGLLARHMADNLRLDLTAATPEDIRALAGEEK